MKATYLFLVSILFASCGGSIKNENVNIAVEEGTNFDQENESITEIKENPKSNTSNPATDAACLGFWVGDFEPDKSLASDKTDKSMYLDEAYTWNRNNKINISIDEIQENKVIGHSVVAGNDRPFEGTITANSNTSYTIEAAEPGDDKYDGKFTFTIADGKLIGTWASYKKLEIGHRKYNLTRKEFSYDPTIKLEAAKPYANWKKVTKEKVVDEYDDEIFEWIKESYGSATEKIYEINASSTLLKKTDVENLKRGDLQIIRNTIYARHGYSYKNRVYRVFFDAQSWYIPVHTDIKKELTEIEKKNIQLLLRYEKNAEEYYDYFGRG